jgi:hypothetical protein
VDERDEFILMQTISIFGSDEIPGATGRFGLDVTNPIPVRAHSGLKEYFSLLSKKSNKKYSYDRLGSTSSPNIPKMVDIYRIKDQEGTKCPDLYMCLYGDSTSKKVPEGF